eukprot:Opistho-2@31377
MASRARIVNARVGRIALCVAVMLSIASCVNSVPVSVTLLHTNELDQGVAASPFDRVNNAIVGGAARISTLFNNVRTEVDASRVITVDAGTFLSSTRLLQKNGTVVYRAIADSSKYNFLGLNSGDLFFGTPPLRQLLLGANFKTVLSSIDDRGIDFFSDLIVRSAVLNMTVDGVAFKVGFVGYTRPDLCRRTQCNFRIRILDQNVALKAEILKLRTLNKVDFIIALSGAGLA